MSSTFKRFFVVVMIFGFFILGGAGTSLVASQELAKEQEVVLAVGSGDIGSSDPMASGMHQDRVVMYHIFSALVRYPIGDCAAGKFEPDLATKWEVSPDKLNWTFHLRKGVKWHGGFGEVTAEDVIYSLNRVKNGKVSAWRGGYDNFKEVKALDKYTVQITTAKPEPYLLTKLANAFGGFIVCKKAIEKAGAFDRAIAPTSEEVIGTGPFKFLEYKPKDRIILVRNDDYWGGKAIIEKLTIRFVPDDSARQLALLKGEVHGYNGIADKKLLKYLKSQGIVVEPMGPADLKALYFNLKVKPFDDKRVREAFAYGCSQQSIFDFQGEEISHISSSPVPSGLYGHADAGWSKYKYDPQKAKKLLAEAGYPNGLNVKLFMSLGAWYLDKMVIFQNELREAGINLEMTKVDHTVYKNKIFEGLNPVVIWGFQYPLATYWLRNMYHSDSIVGTPKGSSNFMYYSNPQVDKLIELAETTFDDKVHVDALAKAQRIVVEDLPAIPVIETRVPNVRVPWLDLGYEAKNNFLWHLEIGLKTRILKH